MQRRTQSRHTGLFLVLCAAMLLLSMVTQQPWAAGARGYAKGAIEPMEAGMMAVAARVGAVTSVLGDVSIVQTLADPQSRVSAFLSKSGLQGTVIGGPGSLEMQIDPRFGIAPAVGEWVITNGVGGGYPRGLVVAQVAAVNHNDAATVDEAVLAW